MLCIICLDDSSELKRWHDGQPSLTSDGALLVLVELAFDKAQHQAGLPHRRFPQQHQLELADLVACCCAVGPCWSASPCHGAVLETGSKPGEEGGSVVEFRLRFGAGAGEGWVRLSYTGVCSVQAGRWARGRGDLTSGSWKTPHN